MMTAGRLVECSPAHCRRQVISDRALRIIGSKLTKALLDRNQKEEGWLVLWLGAGLGRKPFAS